jgi:hypothetical protein
MGGRLILELLFIILLEKRIFKFEKVIGKSHVPPGTSLYIEGVMRWDFAKF